MSSLSTAWDAQHIVWCHILESFAITCLLHLGYYCISFFNPRLELFQLHSAISVHPCPPNLVIFVGSHGIVHRFNPNSRCRISRRIWKRRQGEACTSSSCSLGLGEILEPDDWKSELNVASLSLDVWHIIPIHMCVHTHRLCYMYVCCCPHIRRIRCFFPLVRVPCHRSFTRMMNLVISHVAPIG